MEVPCSDEWWQDVWRDVCAESTSVGQSAGNDSENIPLDPWQKLTSAAVQDKTTPIGGYTSEQELESGDASQTHSLRDIEIENLKMINRSLLEVNNNLKVEQQAQLKTAYGNLDAAAAENDALRDELKSRPSLEEHIRLQDDISTLRENNHTLQQHSIVMEVQHREELQTTHGKLALAAAKNDTLRDELKSRSSLEEHTRLQDEISTLREKNHTLQQHNIVMEVQHREEMSYLKSKPTTLHADDRKSVKRSRDFEEEENNVSNANDDMYPRLGWFKRLKFDHGTSPADPRFCSPTSCCGPDFGNDVGRI
ncbi:hypothetical protein, variant 1 [Sphaeroforma arctica JP610]|uniref:Uncharacterized protein n=1 Tax=Sphaeroforma arctica JP610 TaxID=667725 RepID=A0A0L0FAD9_9EUKA|nr:hypothetical protein, variant 2 [Sphaeroforma arctica JP610]XP_014147607.1 hypothetical protein, variant 1 [Sphaeroforma arctica JP610]KNC73704.1 hypothetical protein, variant 2 [Sphaeroforma arctica JP610]KNC73705.1 hypothetical protein, variant 1 [Sphaeroforma arctica JP610]|eukprot:XP_014147606.1 hypothetical protein, variant 2 [Sphaeroforma arctica JP610]